jgi:PAS domain S-box-containing protein
LLAMMALVAGVTITTLLIAENQVRTSYERHFQESFAFQVESFLREREARLMPVKERIAEGAASPRVVAAMENAGQPGADQQDIDDLYNNGVDQEFFKADARERTKARAGFFFFLNTNGVVLYPSPRVKLPFTLPGLRRITPEIELISQDVSLKGAQEVGYLAPWDETTRMQIREMVFTPVVDEVSRRRLGTLAVGFPVPELRDERTPLSRPSEGAIRSSSPPLQRPASGEFLSGIWLDDQIYSPSIPAGDLAQMEETLGRELKAGRSVWSDYVVQAGGVPHQLFCQALNNGSAFPPAYEVCLYSLADAETEKSNLRRKFLVLSSVALLGALGLSLLMARNLAGPLRELVRGTMQIEQGNYQFRVPVQARDEVGQLTEAFNEMTERVHASHLAQEQRIAERTQELAERKRAQESLRQSEASLREAQRIAHLGNWRWQIGTGRLEWSDEIYSILGLSPESFSPTYDKFLECVHPEDREKVRLAVTQSLKAGTPYNLEHRVIRPDGEVRIVQERGEAVFDSASGQAGHMVGTVQDVTEQKRIEAEFLRAQRLDSIGALAGGMAHDLNNALSPILVGIQLIRRQSQDPETKQMLTTMEANTRRGADLVRQVLTFARGREAEREPLDLGGLIREMENILHQTLPRSIRVTAMVPRDLWMVLGNATQLHQVLLNLCVNARDAMPEGGELTLAADNVDLSAEDTKGHSEAAPGPHVMLFVSDTGTGISSDVLPRIFEPFFTTKGPGKGTGLGLSTIARIVRNHSGFITVKSEPEGGTTFEICLPRAESRPAPQFGSVASPAEFPLGHGELILFVDDDRSMREMVIPTLTEHGYQVLSASNGADALVLLDQNRQNVALVLSDLAMPIMDGKATLQAVHARLPKLPVILMSGEVDTLHGNLPPGAAAFLPKPFRLEQLLTAINDALLPRRPPA